MINLIPPSAKRNIAFEYWTRIVSAWLILMSGIFAITTVLLLPVYVLLNSQIAAYAESATEALNKVSEYDISSSALGQANVRAGLILDLNDSQQFSALVTLLESLQNPSIFIERLTLERSEGKIQPIGVSGKALTRQALADFREDLLEHPDIDTVFLPISNLAQDRNISFTITVTMKSPE